MEWNTIINFWLYFKYFYFTMNLPIFDSCSVEEDKNIKRILDHKGIINSTVFFVKETIIYSDMIIKINQYNEH